MRAKAQQYTIRNIPPSLDRALRRRAAERKVSLNALVLRILEQEAGGTETRAKHDLDAFFGTWIEDRGVERALTEQRRVDPSDWQE